MSADLLTNANSIPVGTAARVLVNGVPGCIEAAWYESGALMVRIRFYNGNELVCHAVDAHQYLDAARAAATDANREQAVVAARAEICVCGHPKSAHREVPSEAIPPTVLACTIYGCACGPGCIHEGYVDRDTPAASSPVHADEEYEARLVHYIADNTWSIVVPRGNGATANLSVPRIVAQAWAKALPVQEHERAFGDYPWTALDVPAERLALQAIVKHGHMDDCGCVVSTESGCTCHFAIAQSVLDGKLCFGVQPGSFAECVAIDALRAARGG